MKSYLMRSISEFYNCESKLLLMMFEEDFDYFIERILKFCFMLFDNLSYGSGYYEREVWFDWDCYLFSFPKFSSFSALFFYFNSLTSLSNAYLLILKGIVTRSPPSSLMLKIIQFLRSSKCIIWKYSHFSYYPITNWV